MNRTPRYVCLYDALDIRAEVVHCSASNYGAIPRLVQASHVRRQLTSDPETSIDDDHIAFVTGDVQPAWRLRVWH